LKFFYITINLKNHKLELQANHATSVHQNAKKNNTTQYFYKIISLYELECGKIRELGGYDSVAVMFCWGCVYECAKN